MNNNPLRYNDPSGHDVQCTLDEGCWETNNDGSVGGSGSGIDNDEDDKDDDGIDDMANSCGQANVLNCLPPLLACYQNMPCLIDPQLTMHPTDITRGGILIARIIIRAADGSIIGYREVIYVPNDSGWAWNGNAPGELNSIVMATSGLAVGVTEYLLELVPVIGLGLGALALIDAVNQNIENSGHFVVSPIIPQHDLDNQINLIVPELQLR